VRPGINKNTQKGVFVYSGWGALNSLARHSGAGCAQPVTILVRVRFQNLLGFEPATKLRMVSVAATNIKTPKRAFEYWLGRTGASIHNNKNQKNLPKSIF